MSQESTSAGLALPFPGCEACRRKDAEIASLESELAELRKTVVRMIDPDQDDEREWDLLL